MAFLARRSVLIDVEHATDLVKPFDFETTFLEDLGWDHAPATVAAVDTLNRRPRSGISDEELSHLVVDLREDGRLCLADDEDQHVEPRIVGSLGLACEGSGTCW